MTEPQAAEIAATCYHEGRHAEQLWLEARVMATQGKKDAATIATELDLLPATAKLAINPALPKVPTSLLPQIADWTALRGGRYKAFWHWNESFRGFPEKLTVPLPDIPDIEKLSFADLVSLSTKIHGPVAGWEKDSFPPFAKVMKDADAIRGRNALDVKTIGDIHRINKAFTRLFKGEKTFAAGLAALDQRVKDKASGKRPFTAQQATAMLTQSRAQGVEAKMALIDITLATNEAYRNYPHEADSYLIGDRSPAASRPRTKPRRRKPHRRPNSSRQATSLNRWSRSALCASRSTCSASTTRPASPRTAASRRSPPTSRGRRTIRSPTPSASSRDSVRPRCRRPNRVTGCNSRSAPAPTVRCSVMSPSGGMRSRTPTRSGSPSRRRITATAMRRRRSRPSSTGSSRPRALIGSSRTPTSATVPYGRFAASGFPARVARRGGRLVQGGVDDARHLRVARRGRTPPAQPAACYLIDLTRPPNGTHCQP